MFQTNNMKLPIGLGLDIKPVTGLSGGTCISFLTLCLPNMQREK
jgi:hypothetical protein